jgi:hypothetical protein
MVFVRSAVSQPGFGAPWLGAQGQGALKCARSRTTSATIEEKSYRNALAPVLGRAESGN